MNKVHPGWRGRVKGALKGRGEFKQEEEEEGDDEEAASDGWLNGTTCHGKAGAGWQSCSFQGS